MTNDDEMMRIERGRPVPIHASGPGPSLPHLMAELDRLRAENARLRERLYNARYVARNRGADVRREEADALLPFFTSEWEPMSVIAKRSGFGSASEMASRARDLVKRGMIEDRWAGTSLKLYRARISETKKDRDNG